MDKNKFKRENVDKIENIQPYFSSLYTGTLLSLAGFPDRKIILQKYKDNTEKIDLIKKVWNYLEQHFQNKASKFFPIIWDYIERNPNKNVQEILDDSKVVLNEFNKIQGLDINKYPSYEELNKEVNSIFLSKLQKEKPKEIIQDTTINPGDSTKLYEDNQIVVFRINSSAGANALAGHDTSWCIARKSGSYYNQYTSTNQIFYFCINKTLPVDNPLQKVAVRVTKDINTNEVSDINYTSKINDGDNKDPSELPWFSKVKGTIENDALKQPPTLLVKVKHGKATPEEEEALWKSYKSATLEEKKQLNQITNNAFKAKLDQIESTEFSSIPSNWKELDAVFI